VSLGSITFAGRDVTRLPAERRARLGLARTFQSLELFEDLSVRDNLLAAAMHPRWHEMALEILKLRRRSSVHRDHADEMLDSLGLGDLGDALPAEVSHGQRKLVGVARALAMRPKLLLLDEPAAGLDTAESELLGLRLRSFLKSGMSIFLIDHDMSLVLTICDDIYVLDFGRVIAHGAPSVIRTDPRVIAAYLGHCDDALDAGTSVSTPGGIMSAESNGP
jgi:ABC-type branched-subunit amino acid transport system ATPase component